MPSSVQNSFKGSNTAPRKIQFLDEDGEKVKINGRPLLLAYDGKANLVDNTRVDINSDGFSLRNRLNLKEGTVTDSTKAYFLVIQTNKCDICANGKYMFDESIQQIGYFEFKGIGFYRVQYT